jgi:predicted HTH transcriptional regulator
VLFLARYIEKYGTGILMMIRESLAHGLPEPDFAQRGGEFTTAVWRDWLTDEALATFHLNERQRGIVAYLKRHERITNKEVQTAFSVAKRTASLDLAALVSVGLLEKLGTTGKGVFYRFAKGAPKGQKGQKKADPQEASKGQ